MKEIGVKGSNMKGEAKIIEQAKAKAVDSASSSPEAPEV